MFGTGKKTKIKEMNAASADIVYCVATGNRSHLKFHSFTKPAVCHFSTVADLCEDAVVVRQTNRVDSQIFDNTP